MEITIGVIGVILLWCFIWRTLGHRFFEKRFGEIIRRELYDEIDWTTSIILWMTIFTGYLIIKYKCYC